VLQAPRWTQAEWCRGHAPHRAKQTSSLFAPLMQQLSPLAHASPPQERSELQTSPSTGMTGHVPDAVFGVTGSQVTGPISTGSRGPPRGAEPPRSADPPPAPLGPESASPPPVPRGAGLLAHAATRRVVPTRAQYVAGESRGRMLVGRLLPGESG
jgi:hypothetical protein